MELESDFDVFQKAANYVKTIANNLESSQLLYFYARFKQVNEGVCNTSKPGFFDFQGKQKWQAWKDMGDKKKEDCMQEYIDQLTSVDPDWEIKLSSGEVKPKTGLGVAVSRPAGTDDAEIPEASKTLYDWVKEDCVESVCRMLATDGTLVNKTDDQGMTCLHWASDRGSAVMVQTLLQHSADVNAQDLEGQTPLHYATCCEHVEVVRKLLENHADSTICDSNGDLPETESDEIKDLLKQHRLR